MPWKIVSGPSTVAEEISWAWVVEKGRKRKRVEITVPADAPRYLVGRTVDSEGRYILEQHLGDSDIPDHITLSLGKDALGNDTVTEMHFNEASESSGPVADRLPGWLRRKR